MGSISEKNPIENLRFANNVSGGMLEYILDKIWEGYLGISLGDFSGIPTVVLGFLQ